MTLQCPRCYTTVEVHDYINVVGTGVDYAMCSNCDWFSFDEGYIHELVIEQDERGWTMEDDLLDMEI